MLGWGNLTIAKALKEASEKWGNREGDAENTESSSQERIKMI